jgi:hypothetical protein
MNKRFILIIFFVLLGIWHTNIYCAVPSRAIDDPQLHMVGARALSMGVTNPVLGRDINNSFINPASIYNLTAMPISITHKKLLDEFDYNVVNISYPFDIPISTKEKDIKQKCVIGLSYGSSVLNGVPETVMTGTISQGDARFWKTGTYSSGFNVLEGFLATEFYDVLGFNEITLGAGGKILQQFIKSEARYGMSLDIGTIATYYVDEYFIDKFLIGASILNCLSTPLIWPDSGDEAYLPFDTFLGFGITTFDDSVSLFAHNTLEGLSIATEYNILDLFFFRASSITDFSRFNIGTGMKFENIVAFGDQEFSMRLDYNYSQVTFPYDSDPTNTLSMSVMGESRPSSPKILIPEEKTVTNNIAILLHGVGPKNTTIRIFNNEALVRTALTNKYGIWTFKYFPLIEGENNIYVKSYSFSKDISYESDRVMVIRDTEPPDMQVIVYPDNSKLNVDIGIPTGDISKEIVHIEGLLENEKLEFKLEEKDKVWRAEFEIPEGLEEGSFVSDKMSWLKLFAEDAAGNQTEILEIPFFVKVLSPKDKFVHYKEAIRVLGNSSDMTKKVYLNDAPVYIDQYNNFSFGKKLDPGKNLLKLKVQTLNDRFITYTMRVLRLVTFLDLTKQVKERREIEFMATLGILDGDIDGNFYPDKMVSRMYITKMLVKLNKYPLEPVEYDLFTDVPATHPDAQYIQAAIQNGLVFAFPDGTFKPEQTLTLSEIIFFLSNAGIIEEEEPEDGERYITRKELARFLAYLPKYEFKIERLIDWEKGYR